MQHSDYLVLPRHLPLTWSESGDLVIGHDRVHAVFARPSAATQKFIDGLRRGVHRHRLGTLARRAGLSEEEAVAVLRDMSPVLGSSRSSPGGRAPARIVIGGPLPRSMMLHAQFRANDWNVVHALPDDLAHVDAVVFTERYLGSPFLPQRLRAAGLPHLPIRFSDASISIGPLLGGDGPCYGCLVERPPQRDDEWLLRAVQLMGCPAPSERADLVPLAASFALVTLNSWRVTGELSRQQQQILLDPSGGIAEITSRTVEPARGCDCTVLATELADESRDDQSAALSPA